jgi:hypothetical protein
VRVVVEACRYQQQEGGSDQYIMVRKGREGGKCLFVCLLLIHYFSVTCSFAKYHHSTHLPTSSYLKKSFDAFPHASLRYAD